jgi:hypothetical protein
MGPAKKNNSYNLFKIRKNKESQLIKSLLKAGMDITGEKTVKDFRLALYILIDPTVPIWWTDTYQSYFKSQPIPENELYCGVFLVSNDKLCYAVSMGKSYLYLKHVAEPTFGVNLAQRITDSTREAEITAHTLIPMTDDTDDTTHHVTAPTIDKKWGSSITYGQSVRFHLPITPDQLPDLIQDIEKELTKDLRAPAPSTIENPKEPIRRVTITDVTSIEIEEGVDL